MEEEEHKIGCKHRYDTEAFKSDARSVLAINIFIILLVGILAFYVAPWALLGLFFMQGTSVEKVNTDCSKCEAEKNSEENPF
jgi:hypothetical protein